MSDIVFDAETIIGQRASKYADDERIPNLLIIAEELLGDKIPKTNPREYAKALQVLHWLTLDDLAEDGASGTGSIAMEKEGDLQVKYNNATGNLMYFQSDWKSDLTRTGWGLELYAFIKRYIVLAVTRFSW
jgi:hypothetical protein